MKLSQHTLKKRIKHFQNTFHQLCVDAFLIENPTDIFYFTGLKISRGKLFIMPKSVYLCVDGRYIEMAKNLSPFPVQSIENSSVEKLWKLSRYKKLKTIGFDTSISFADHKKHKVFFNKLNKKLKGYDLPIQQERVIKDSSEIRYLKKSADLLWKCFLHLRTSLKEGISEKELAYLFELFAKKHGADSLAFDPIIAFGSHSALPHHHCSNRKLKKNDCVLIDIGVNLNGYMSDMTRVIFFGTVSKKIEEIDRVVKEVHRKVLKKIRPGVEVAVLDQFARDLMGKYENFFLHSLGHGIGLNVHEYPLISTKTKNVKLKQGMVITIEPGLYLPGIGGVRHEDMVVITKTGYQNFFNCL